MRVRQPDIMMARWPGVQGSAIVKNSLLMLMKNKAGSIDDAECFLHHYLESRHHAKWHSHAASESEEYALCQSQMTPTG